MEITSTQRLDSQIKKLAELEAEHKDIADRFAAEIDLLKERSEGLLAPIKERIDRLETEILNETEALGKTKFEGVYGSVTSRRSSALNITVPVEELPEEFQRIKVDFNRTAVNADIKNGHLTVTPDGQLVDRDGAILEGITKTETKNWKIATVWQPH